MMKRVSHEQASQLLHNKFVVVLGDSIQRSVYKDLVLLLQKERFLSQNQLKSKGEMSFEQDCLVEGGCLREMNNGTDYREVRQFRTDNHLVRFYFVTRIYSAYMRSILEDFRLGSKPDVVIVNSCVWDISRYSQSWAYEYKENLRNFFWNLNRILPQSALVMWNMTMPLGTRIRGGFLVPEIEHKAPSLRQDVIEANFYSGTLANAYGMDVLDLHFHFRFSLEHRIRDGVHWNAIAHRKITSLVLQHSAHAWGVDLSSSLKPAGRDSSNAENFTADVWNDGDGFKSFSVSHTVAPRLVFPSPMPQSTVLHRSQDSHFKNDCYDQENSENHTAYVMRSRRARHHYAPYSHQRPRQYGHNDM
ncbi:uncharacterized protein V6R79_000022 [Siganus canaliculatus]